MNINRIFLLITVFCFSAHAVDQATVSIPSKEVANVSVEPAAESRILVRLEEEQVHEWQKKIAQDIAWRTWKKRAAYVAMGAFVLYSAYDFYSSIVAPTVPLATYQAALEGGNRAPRRMTWYEWITSGSTWQNAGWWVVGSIGSTVVGNSCYGFMSAYTEPSVIAWYVARVAPTEALIHSMYSHAEKLAYIKVNTPRSADFYYTALINEHSMLMTNIAKTLGFMRYKAECMPAQRQGYASMLVRHSIAELNRMTTELERLIVNKYGGIGRVIAEIDMEIQKMCAQFANIEGSPWVDAHQMQGLVLTHLLNG